MEKQDTKEKWIVDTDLKADWVIRKLKELEQEENRQLNLIDSVIQEYKSKKEKIINETQRERSNFESMLIDYIRTNNLNWREQKTQKKYALASGDLIIKKAKKDFKRDSNKIIEYMKDKKEYEDYIQYKPSLKWADLKKHLEIIDGNILNKETGEVLEIEGLEIETKPEELQIKY